MNLILKNRDNALELENEFDRLQREFANTFGFGSLFANNGDPGLFDRSFSPSIDLLETEDSFVLYAELPGVDKKDLELSVENNVLSLKGEKKEQKESKGFFRKETWAGSFRRTVALPQTADSEKVKAELANGVLQVTVGKREESKPRRITVNA